MNIVRCP